MTIFTSSIYLIVEKLDVFNFHSIFFLFLSLVSHSLERFEHVFFFKYTLKVEIVQRRKTRLKIFVFLDIKMSAKSNKIELSEKFMVM